MNYDLYEDIQACAWICNKVRSSDTYAQNLYAAFCNNEFQKLDMWEVLRGQDRWAVSWRRAGRIIAEIRGQGDYMDWYCTGIQDPAVLKTINFVGESVVTDEIRQDLRQLGWTVITECESE